MFASFQAWSACSKKTFNVKPLWSDNPYRWQISHDYFSPFPCQAFLPIGPHSGCSDWPSSPARRGRGTAAFDIDTPTSHTPSNDLDQTVCLLGHQKVCFFSLSGRALPSPPPSSPTPSAALPSSVFLSSNLPRCLIRRVCQWSCVLNTPASVCSKPGFNARFHWRLHWIRFLQCCQH